MADYYVSSGVTSSGIILNNQDIMSVYSCGTANSTTVNYGGYLGVSSGGTANDTTVNSNGHFEIYDGGLVRNTTVNSYGWMNVSSGGTAAGTTVNSGGFMFVSSGGTATGTTLNSWGVTSVLFGGTANSTTVHSKGFILVMFGGRANDTTVNEGGTLFVVSGGTAADTTFNSKGSLILSSGGKLTGKMRFGSDMTMDVASGSILDFDLTQTAPDADALVYNSLSLLLNKQFTCTLTVDGTEADGKYNLMDGAAGFNKTITIVNLLGEELGTLTVGGGTRTIGKRKYTLSLDESMLSVTVKLIPDMTGDLKREANLSSGMYASGVNVLSGGELTVLNGGFASMTTVNSKGIMYVSSGGKADGVTVYFDCDLYVSSGGTATQIMENGGYVNVNSDASATFIPNSFSGYTYSSYRNYATLHSGTTGTSLTATGSGNIIVNGGYTEATTLETKGNLRVFCGGKASSNYIDSGGILYVSSGGTAINNLVFSGGTMYVSSGGTGIYTSVYSGGSMYVSAGGSANLVIVDGGYLEVYGTATMVDWEPCNGYLRIGNGADVTFRYQHSGVYYGTGNQLLSSAMVMESKTLPDGTYDSLRMYVMSGGTANATTVNEGGRIEVWSGGTANGTTLNGSGSMTLYSGGTANDTTINARAYLYVPRGGSVNGTTIHYRGNMSVSSGGKANGVTVNSGGSMTVSAGGMATQIMENGGYVSVNDTTVTFIPNVISGISVEQTRVTLHSGTTATDATIDASGYMYVYSGGSANAITVNSGGALYVSSGGTADSVTVHSGGWLFVSGGTATNVDWTPCVGKVLIGAGAYVKFVSQYSGVYYGADEQLLSNARVMISKTVSVDAQWHKTIMYVMTDGLASCTTVNSGGSVYVSAGGTADTTTVNAGGYVYDYGSACCTTVNKDGRLLVYSDAAADTTTVNSGGSMSVSSGGAASNTTVNSGGCMIISSGGSTVDTTTVNSGGSMIVYSGGTATGKMTFAKGAYVSVLEGAKLDFDINIVSPDNDPFVNDLSLVQGAPTYTLTVAGTEELGDYKLAEGAAGFDKTITVVNTSGTELGTLSLAGGTQTIGGVDYTLNLGNDNVLSVTIAGNTPPIPSVTAKSDINGNGVSDVMFVWTKMYDPATQTYLEGNYMHGYWLDGANNWYSVGGPHPAEWENLGCHDMTGDGKADSVLVGNVILESGSPGAYIGYYKDGNDLIDGSTWVTIGLLDNGPGNTWKNCVGNLTGSDTAKCIVWYAPELYVVGAWLDSTDQWVGLSGHFGGDAWKLVGCGDFDGDGKESIVMSGYDGAYIYSLDFEGPETSMGATNWSGWEVRAIGDFAGDGKDDLVLFNQVYGLMAMAYDGNLDDFDIIGQLDAQDWFVVGAGDYNGDAKDDLLVRQYSTGMLGYYTCGDTSQWNVLGYGVGMEWTVIA